LQVLVSENFRESVSLRTLPDLQARLAQLRSKLQPVFSRDTAMAGSRGVGPSAGHCAAVAAIVFDNLGGKLVSTIVQGESHWFNRFRLENEIYDVDITGDQWARPSIQVGKGGALYPGTRVRKSEELNEETLRRALKLAARAGISLSKLRRVA
jgi:hypothetical protein